MVTAIIRPCLGRFYAIVTVDGVMQETAVIFQTAAEAAGWVHAIAADRYAVDITIEL